MLTYRLAAGGIILHDNKIALVHYKKHGFDLLVCPGGGVEITESMEDTVVREAREETGLVVEPIRFIFVEDGLSRKCRMVKFWFLCKLVGGALEKTAQADEEGILDVEWYSREELTGKTVFPAIVLTTDWRDFQRDDWQIVYSPLKQMNF